MSGEALMNMEKLMAVVESFECKHWTEIRFRFHSLFDSCSAPNDGTLIPKRHGRRVLRYQYTRYEQSWISSNLAFVPVELWYTPGMSNSLKSMFRNILCPFCLLRQDKKVRGQNRGTTVPKQLVSCLRKTMQLVDFDVREHQCITFPK